MVAILVFRLNAFLALVVAAIVVALLSPGDPAATLGTVADGFGKTAGRLGVIVALAAIIGAAMARSGASDRIVKGFVRLLGEDRGAMALGATAFVLSLPVFFDTIFFLLAPLAKSMYRRTNKNYLKYLLAMSATGISTHVLVPPHPGPLAMADALGVDLGVMILVGIVVALPASVAGMLFARWADRRMPILLREDPVEPSGPVSAELPGLIPSLVPVLLPVVLISSNTIVAALRTALPSQAATWARLGPFTGTLGNPAVALLLSAGFALVVYALRRRPSREEMSAMVEAALMGAGVIVLIVGAGGAFGAALQAADIGSVVQGAFRAGAGGSIMALLFVAFGASVVIKIAQGSSTVAMVTTSSMLAAMTRGVPLPFHPVYLATAIAGGSLIGSWMNDAGFWVFSRVGSVTELETLRSWSPLAAIVGGTIMATTVVLVLVLPLR